MEPTERVLNIFEKLSAIPRGSGNEAGVRVWLEAWAEEHSYRSRSDPKGNLCVYVPATSGYAGQPVLIIQGHMDMVCQKTASSSHDFRRDPIRLWRDGDWLRAKDTTLGADNGIALALAMALVEDPSVSHPALELLFTVEEEVGLVGADQIDPSLLTGKTLLNLDGEKEGTLTIGCAGGGGVVFIQPAEWEVPNSGSTTFEIKISGLRGGHSGEDIHRHRANANKALARTLDMIQQTQPLNLAYWQGGTARNAIPTTSRAVFTCTAQAASTIQQFCATFEQTLQAEYARTEPGLKLSLQPVELPEKVCSLTSTQSMLGLMIALPNGVAEFSAEVEGAVETSNNLGVVELKVEGLQVVSSQRSSVFSRLQEITRRVETIGELSGAQISSTKLNPPWMPDLSSPLLKKCQQVYQDLFGTAPRLEVTHGGLEVGRLSERCGGLDGISIGATLRDLHSPDEMLYIPSLAPVYNFLVALLKH